MDRQGDTQGMTGRSGEAFDELLVVMVLAGERRAAERLAARWYPRLLRTARRLLQDEEQAKVAVQEAWIAILRGIAGLKDPTRFAPWAFGILRRKCVDRIRTARARRGRAGGPPVEELAAAPEGIDDRLAILQAFARLPRDQRLAAHLHYVEGLSLGEIAAVADVPEGTVKSRLFHARRRLKAVLKGDDQ